MTYDIAVLRDLLERVRTAKGPDRELDCAIAVGIEGFFVLPSEYEGQRPRYGRFDPDGTEVRPGQAGDMLVRYYTFSIDACVALIERVLPGWYWETGRDGMGWVRVMRDGLIACDSRFDGKTLPLALLDALLQALIAQHEHVTDEVGS